VLQQVVGALSSMLKDMPPRLQRKRRNMAEPPSPIPESLKQKFGELIIGLNSVTRALEKDELRLVVSTRDLSPSRVIQHLPVLCTLRSVPICPISMTSQALAELLGASEIRTVICMGFKRTNKPSEWDEIVSLISSKTPAIDVPWIPSNASSLNISSAEMDIEPSNQTMKAKRQQTKLARLKVRKSQHTAPIKPSKNIQKVAKASSSAPAKPSMSKNPTKSETKKSDSEPAKSTNSTLTAVPTPHPS
jgi:ribosomal protein L7Ae-like RNA K-turn-binding protein